MSDPGKAGAEAQTEPLPIVPLRHWGRWIAAVIIFLFVVAVLYVLAKADIAYADVPKFSVFPIMLEGLWHTIILAIAAQSAGIAIGLVIAIMRRSENPVAWCTAGLYIWIFRGVPVLLQLLIWYNLALAFKAVGVPGLFSISTNAVMTPFVAGLLGLGLNESAYMAEIIRAGFNSIDIGRLIEVQPRGYWQNEVLARLR